MFLLVGKGHTSNSETEGWLMDERAERVKGAVVQLSTSSQTPGGD